MTFNKLITALFEKNNFAKKINSLTHYAKGTLSHQKVLELLL
jgi:hypothetical protein